MSQPFIGCRVRVVRATNPINVGRTGRIERIGMWRTGDRLPNGYRLGRTVSAYSNVMVRLDDGILGPANWENLEPILDPIPEPVRMVAASHWTSY